jgi:hypothetical protein
MAEKCPPSDRQEPDRVPAGSPQPMDIDDAATDEAARIPPAPKQGWRERDANRRGHGADDLKA